MFASLPDAAGAIRHRPFSLKLTDRILSFRARCCSQPFCSIQLRYQFPAICSQSIRFITTQIQRDFRLFSAYSAFFCAYPPFCVSMRFHCIPGPFIYIGVLSLALASLCPSLRGDSISDHFFSITVPLQSIPADPLFHSLLNAANPIPCFAHLCDAAAMPCYS